jgi:hypothetical protein
MSVGTYQNVLWTALPGMWLLLLMMVLLVLLVRLMLVLHPVMMLLTQCCYCIAFQNVWCTVCCSIAPHATGPLIIPGCSALSDGESGQKRAFHAPQYLRDKLQFLCPL